MNTRVPAPPLLGVHDVRKSFGAQDVLRGMSLTVHEGDRIGVIGLNGSGKSTLLKVMAGVFPPDSGHTTCRQGLRVALLRQQDGLDLRLTLGEALEHAQRGIRDRVEQYHRHARQFAERPDDVLLSRRVADLEHALELAGAWELDRDIKRLCVALDLPHRDRPLHTLSGGERRRADLAATLIQRPDLLLLDEPTNHIDINSIQWIERFLAGYHGSCVLVTHDRYFLDRVVNRIVEITSGKLVSFPGNYERFLEHKAARAAEEARVEENRHALMRRELAWLRRGAKARTTKQKARIKRFDTIEGQDPEAPRRDFTFLLPAPPRLGKRVLEAEGISRAYGDHVLFRDFSLIMQGGMRVGVIGPNGCGKTTLLRVLMGLEPSDEGAIYRGDATEFLYVDQTHEEVAPDATIIQHVSNGATEVTVNARDVHVPVYLEGFLFDHKSIHMPMRNLSGGERNRLDIARKLLRGGNFLILDEPTNDLDLPTLRVVEELVLSFNGCAMIVSHDRYFLNRLCTHVLVFDEDGRVVLVAGDYDNYLVYHEHRQALKEPPPVPARTAPKPRPTTEQPRRLTWREKKELEGAEQAIQAVEAEIRAIEARIHQPGFYESDYTDVNDALHALEAAKARAEHLYARWVELTDVAEG